MGTTPEADATTDEAVTTRHRDDPFTVVCHESEDGMAVFVPHPSDCSLYYECVGLTPVLMSCPGDLYFDPQLDVCNWPDLVDCQPPTTTTTTTTSTTTTTTEAEADTTTVEAATTTSSSRQVLDGVVFTIFIGIIFGSKI